jgi:chromosome segregation ATPase
MDLKSAMIAGSSESSRNHAIMRLQERLTSLDSQLLTAAELKDDAESSLRLALQAKAIAEDQTALVRSQLRTLRKNYDQDVAKLRPMLEDQVRNAQTDLHDVQALRSDTALHSARMASLQKQVVDFKDALASARINEHDARTDAAETRIELAECQKQNAKLSRMQTVIVAAKLNFQDQARSLTKRINDQEMSMSLLKTEAIEAQRKAHESELMCDNLRKEVMEKVAMHASMRDQLMLWKAEAASEHLATKSMRNDLNEILETDSAAFRDDFARISNELANEREISERLNKQLRTAMHRIYELQGQLLNDRTESEVEVTTEVEVV